MNVSKSLLGMVGISTILLGGPVLVNLIQLFPPKAVPQITLVEAVEEVLETNPGTVAMDVNLRRETSGLAWEVTLNNDVRVSIDANTKQIVKSEQRWNLASVPILGELMLDQNLADF